MQNKKQKQKLEKLLSKNESEGDESMQSNPHKSDQAGSKHRRDSKNKAKKDFGMKSFKSEKVPDMLRSKSDAPKLIGKKRKQSHVSGGSEIIS
jgi:hypothetical protein